MSALNAVNRELAARRVAGQASAAITEARTTRSPRRAAPGVGRRELSSRTSRGSQSVYPGHTGTIDRAEGALAASTRKLAPTVFARGRALCEMGHQPT